MSSIKPSECLISQEKKRTMRVSKKKLQLQLLSLFEGNKWDATRSIIAAGGGSTYGSEIPPCLFSALILPIFSEGLRERTTTRPVVLLSRSSPTAYREWKRVSSANDTINLLRGLQPTKKEEPYRSRAGAKVVYRIS